MPDIRKKVLVSEGSAKQPLDWLREHVDVIEISYDNPAFTSALADVDGLIVRTYTRVTPDLLDKAPRLRVVGRGGVGIENIDVNACRTRGIEVVYTPDANTLAVGDFVFGYILQLVRPWCFFSQSAYPPAEFKKIRNTVRGRQLNELTIGLVGMGRVGRRVASIAQSFGMRVLYNDIRDVTGELDPSLPVEQTTLDSLLRQSDIVSLHVTMLPGNENMIAAAQLALMKPDAILINTSRGEVLDCTSVAEAMRTDRLGGVAIDVYAPEPPPPDFPLLGLKNVLLTPHLAARTYTAIENMSWVTRDVWAVLNDQPPRWSVQR